MYCGGQPPDRGGGTPATWTRISRTATCPRKALVTTRETCRSAGHGLRGVARPSEGASPRLAAVNNPDRLHPQRRIGDSMIPRRGQHQFSTRSGNVRGLTGNNGHSATMPEPSSPAANAGLDGHGAASQPPLTCANANQNAT